MGAVEAVEKLDFNATLPIAGLIDDLVATDL
jgi:hypothetical protein